MKSKIIKSVIILIVLLGGIGVYLGYKTVYQPNVNLGEKKSKFIYIKTNATFDDVLNELYENEIIVNRTTFELLAHKKNYPSHVKPGRYRILATMNNNQIINLLRAGLQEPIDISFDNLRTKEQVAERLGVRLEPGKDAWLEALNSNELAENYGLSSETFLTLFTANTFRFYWNTSIKEVLDLMATTYKTFWTTERKKKAKALGLSQSEVIILASIVQAEQWKYNDEKPIVAGLYLNRIKKDMLLQADPTVVYASGDFTINRVLNEHKEIDSPYNTYKYKGLPPGPILIPETSSIDAVLNYNKHNYLYMCAKEDFSGKHYFNSDYKQHMKCADMYRSALTKEINKKASQ